MKLSEQLKRLIAANAPLWAGEAEIARTWLLATLVADFSCRDHGGACLPSFPLLTEHRQSVLAVAGSEARAKCLASIG